MTDQGSSRLKCAVQGVVKSYTKKHKWFRVEYEDGDRSVLRLQSCSLAAGKVLANHDGGSAVCQLTSFT